MTEKDSVRPICDRLFSRRYQLVQFSDVFLPLINNISSLDGRLIYYNGTGLMFVFPDDEHLKEGDNRYGLSALNSVNKTTRIIIKFSVKYGNKIINVPKTVAGFNRVHTGKSLQVTQNFMSTIEKVKDIWKIIIDNFTKVDVNETYANAVMDDVEIHDKYIRNRVLKKVLHTDNMNLWEMFIYMMEIVEDRKFKSDLHRQKKLDLISEKMFKWAALTKLLNI